jgi:UDP-N-acetylglucosamine acyltransferase
MQKRVLDPPNIHPTAMIDPSARIGAGVVIEPYAIVGRNTSIGEETRIGPFTVVGDFTSIGPRNRVFHHATIGSESQDLKFRGQESYLVIGEGNLFREYTTLNRASGEGESTVVGNHNLFMAYSHLAHNSQLGNHCVIANAAEIGGHVEIGDYVILGGLVAVHQFCLIGSHSIVGAGSKVTQDVPPFILADGHPARPHGLNGVGLRRRGFSDEEIRDIEEAYSLIYRSSLRVEEAIDQLRERLAHSPHVVEIGDLLARATRGIIRPAESKAACFRKVKRSG